VALTQTHEIDEPHGVNIHQLARPIVYVSKLSGATGP